MNERETVWEGRGDGIAIHEQETARVDVANMEALHR